MVRDPHHPLNRLAVPDSLRRLRFLETMKQGARILPSMLLCDFGNLRREVQLLEEAGVPGLHLDVMDGHFVPNFTYGMTIVSAIRRVTSLPLDVHLMIQHPDRYLVPFCEAGADCVTIHAEASTDLERDLATLRDQGVAVGVAFNPRTPVELSEPAVGLCDLVLVMTVQAGFGGQAFQAAALQKVSHSRARFGGDVLFEVDGGVDRTTIRQCAGAGASLFVVGSAIFRQPDYQVAIQALQDALA